MEAITIRPAEQEAWDVFVERSADGTLFHTLKFLSYHPVGKFNFHHLMFYQGEKLVAVLPGSLQDGIYRSPAGASYGSFVFAHESYELIDSVISAFLTYARQQNIREIVLTPPPAVYSQGLNRGSQYSLLHHGFQYSHHLFSSVIALPDYTLDSISSRGRRAVKKALREGLTIELSSDVEKYYLILLENKKKFNTLPTHTLEELKQLIKLFPEKVKLFSAMHKGRMIGGILAMLCNSRVALAFYIAIDPVFQEYRPINLLIFRLAEWAREQGYQYLDLGVNQDTASANPMDLNMSLVSFKESMNGICHLRSTLAKIIVTALPEKSSAGER